MMEVKIDLRDFGRLARDLEKARKSAIPYATRNALNEAAFSARRFWTHEIEKRLVLRNNWTTRTLGVEKARGTNVDRMYAVVGSPNAYMLKQETGGVQRGSVPTGVSAGEGRNTPPRKKLVRQANKLGAIALGQRYRRGTRKQRNAVALRVAASSGNPFAFLDLGKRKGLFRVSGGKRISKVDMLWNTTSKNHRVDAHPTLGPAVRSVEQKLPSIMTSALIDQLKRHRVFGY